MVYILNLPLIKIFVINVVIYEYIDNLAIISY